MANRRDATAQLHGATASARPRVSLVSVLALLGIVWGLAEHPHILGGLALWYAFSVAMTVAHEFGHVAAAYALDYRVDGIVVGSEREVWNGTVLGVPLTLRAFPFGGLARVYPRRCDGVRARAIAVSLAGPLTNAAFAIAAVPLLGVLPIGTATDAAVVEIFILTNVLLLLISLVPYRTTVEGRRQWNDGGHILERLFQPAHKLDRYLVKPLYDRSRVRAAAGDFAGACADVERMWAAFPDKPDFGLYLAQLRLEADDVLGAAALCRALATRADLSEKQRSHALNTVAYADLLSGQAELLAEADRCSADACAGDDVEVAIVETRASVLVALGRANEGVPSLRWVLEQEIDDRDRASAHCSLAIGLLQLGDGEGARSALAAARELDPRARLLARAEAIVAAQPQAGRA